MDFNIHAGQRILYKDSHGWNVGNLVRDGAHLWEDGLQFEIYKKTDGYVTLAAAKDIFFDTRPLEEWEKDREHYDYLYDKEAFLEQVEEYGLRPQTTTAYMSDGEYAYYPVAKFTANWLNKQPFEYVLYDKES